MLWYIDDDDDNNNINVYILHTQVVIAKIDASAERDVGTKYDVSGFPTIKWFPKGEDKVPEPYESAREVKDFVDFINQKAGTARTPDGGLLPSAGRIAAIDKIVTSGNTIII